MAPYQSYSLSSQILEIENVDDPMRVCVDTIIVVIADIPNDVKLKM